MLKSIYLQWPQLFAFSHKHINWGHSTDVHQGKGGHKDLGNFTDGCG